MEKATMTVQEMGQALGVSKPKAYELTEMEGFPCLHIGKRKVIPVDAFRRWLDAQTEGPALAGAAARRA